MAGDKVDIKKLKGGDWKNFFVFLVIVLMYLILFVVVVFIS